MVTFALLGTRDMLGDLKYDVFVEIWIIWIDRVFFSNLYTGTTLLVETQSDYYSKSKLRYGSILLFCVVANFLIFRRVSLSAQ